ncbi:antitoxin [Naumannella cuiyingiana]|uniref:Antitoxin n=1 Tax=Naumannella cuiyingiana TaxID=1347891 RepID=A0A7Z0DBZ3_9ACTN|nr:hypothetical protein [Naumannella cuiyingiana]
MGIFDKAKDLAGQNPDAVNQGIDKAGDFVDQQTGGKFAGQVDQGQEFARGQFGGEAQPEGAPPADQPPADQPPADPPQQ